MQNSYRVKLKKSEQIAEGTMAFYFEKPKGFHFFAGQHVVMTLINPPETDEKGNRRVFCMANAPFENFLMFATRMRDTAFKNLLKTMPLGTEVEIDGPYGTFILHEDASRPAVFLVGGIGITPILSMLRDAVDKKLRHTCYLFYSNRRPEDSAFFEELKNLHRSLPSLDYTFIPTMTEPKKSRLPWNGEKGYIDEKMLKKYLENFIAPMYYVVGPPGFVLSMRGMLNGINIPPQNVKTDQFTGY